MKRAEWLTWALLAFLIASVAFCMPARAEEPDVLQYVAAVAKQSADQIAQIRVDVAALKADAEWNAWLLKAIAGAIIAGAVGVWFKTKSK